MRIVNGSFTFKDAMSGQQIEASDINLKASLPEIAGRLALDGGLTLNQQPVELDIALSSPRSLLDGAPTALTALINSELIQTGYDGGLQTKPVPGLDGTFKLDVASVGKLMTWLQQPLAEDQPDPGPVNILATFKADGTKATIEEATIKGDALDAKASGSFDISGDVKRIALNLESGVLDIDRYLPPPAKREAAPKRAPSGEGRKPKNPMDMLAQISDAPFDLDPLRKTNADITVAMNGVKAAGFEVGKIVFTTKLDGGSLVADLTELALYGGNVTGKVNLQGADDVLSVDAGLNIDKVGVGKLAAAATGGAAPVTGIASGNLAVKASGKSPRALVQALSGGVDFDLSGVDVKDAPQAVSDVKVALDLPGLESPPSLKGSLVYAKRKVGFDVDLDPLDRVLSGERFAVKAAVDSQLAKASYVGFVQQDPVPGLDGAFSADIASVGKLASWLGQPLAKGQKDPGPLNVNAVFKADGEKVALESATLDGKALRASASGSYDGSAGYPKVVLNVESGVLDLDRYLPPPAKGKAAKPAAAGTGGGGNPLAALPNTPLDLSALKKGEADINFDVGGVKVSGLEVGPVKMVTKLAGGKLAADLSELGLYGGSVKGKVNLDASGDALGVVTDVAISNVAAGKLLAAALAGPPPLGGIANGTIKATTSGKSPRSLVQGLQGKFDIKLDGVDIPDTPISKLSAALDLPGVDKPATLRSSVVYQKRPVTVNADLDPLQTVLSGKPFKLKADVSSNLVNGSYNGQVVTQPGPGLDGQIAVDIGSVKKLLNWLGQPFPKKQADPGPLKIAANLAADGAKMALQSATITGKAVEATAKGNFDTTKKVTSFDGDINVSKLDLNAYLPPEKKGGNKKKQNQNKKKSSGGGQAKAQGWSNEPLGFEALRSINGNFRITTGPVTYRELAIVSTKADVNISGGVMKAKLEQLKLDQGTVTAAATVNASGKTAKIDYQAAANGVESKPFLRTFVDIDWLSGKLEFTTKGAASGNSEKQIVGTLNGDGAFKFLDGAIEGFDLAGTLRNAQSLGMSSGANRPKTDFTELSGTYVIQKGVLRNQDLKMLAPLVRVTGKGRVGLPPQDVDYLAEAKLVASLEGQGGNEALAGLPIPVHVHGPWSNIKYDIDWASVFTAAAADPERLLNMDKDLANTAQGLGIKIPGLGGGDTSGTEGGTSGGGTLEGAAGGLIQGILGGGSSDSGTTDSGRDRQRHDDNNKSAGFHRSATARAATTATGPPRPGVTLEEAVLRRVRSKCGSRSP